MKKLFCLALLVSLLFSVSTTAFAADTKPLGLVKMSGTVVEVTDSILFKDNVKNTEVLLHVYEGTTIVTNDGQPYGLDKIKAGDSIVAYVKPAMTMSIPPQTTADAIIVLTTKDETPYYIEVSAVEKADGKLILSDENSKTLTEVTKDTTITPYLTKNILTMDDLVPGTKAFVWKDGSASDKSAAKKLLVLPYSYSGLVEVKDKDVLVDGQKLELNQKEQPYKSAEYSVTMLPLRKVAEQLGATLKYDAKTKSIDVMKGEEKLYTVKIGSDLLKQKTTEYTLSDKVELKDGITFVPARAFELGQNAKVVIY